MVKLHLRHVLMRFCFEKPLLHSTKLAGKTLLINISLTMFGNQAIIDLHITIFLVRVASVSSISAFNIESKQFLKIGHSRLASSACTVGCTSSMISQHCYFIIATFCIFCFFFFFANAGNISKGKDWHCFP